MEKENTQTGAVIRISNHTTGTKRICLQIGMRVKIKNSVEDYSHCAGTVKIITGRLQDFGSRKAYSLDNDTGIWCIEDFEYCVDYPDHVMF